MPTHPSRSERPALLGGRPACAIEWPTWPVHGAREEAGLLDVLRSGAWWYGEQVHRFEREFAAFQGAAHGVSCTNGTAAIEMALRAVGVVPGDEVIVPAYTFIATAAAVVTVGAVPVFADIEQETLCIDPADMARNITPRTKAVVPVHVAGRVADMRRILEIADARGIAVVEDAAHAWGSRWRGRAAGAIGRCGTFSFQVSKNITAGEGGILLTDDADLADLCRSFSHCGRTTGGAWYDHDRHGSNLRMTEFQAVLLRAQLERLADQMERRHRSATILDERLVGTRGIRLLPPASDMERRSHHMIIFRIDEEELRLPRARFLEALRAEGVPASEGWYRPVHRNGVFARAHIGPRHGILAPLAGMGADYTRVECPVCEQVCRDAVWLPQHMLLADDHAIECVAAAIRKVAEHAESLRDAGPR
ncbi:MAG: DegT/DnrJ/EryC1/StrS family aminotransferase [Planctomycetes bacterium]|nr:DegT/DnrJ/EryC1/StrS family aminotransferase [Planctomycetota bacterium]